MWYEEHTHGGICDYIWINLVSKTTQGTTLVQ
jgi:hypothetical protein